ncbi:DUF2809 domain-containing protein [Myxosarcina sp. GI1]|uniref:ribosomal maturation YjgA family protein n=1 Tax=Myxosarcina sp. GI1 TaxID=1541065 RepID=UPI000A79B315|nr:DUF2809 domain-containing protein [Myxosarcina sp. GI1]
MNRNLAIFISILIIVPLGLFSKVYTGIGQTWVRDYSGDILYEVLWCLVFFWFFSSKRATVIIPIWVFIVTSIIEVSQLFFHHVPVALRKTITWKLLLGSSFVWWDFLYYAIGCLLGWLILNRIYRLTNKI